MSVNRGLSPITFVSLITFEKSILGALVISLTIAVLLGSNYARAGIVEDYNSKPIASGNNSSDSRWKERARMPNDPEVVLGKDWRRTFWAFSPSFANQFVFRAESRPPQPAHLLVEKLSPGLEAIEIRVSWDVEENLYRCSYHLFISPEVPVSPEAERVPGVGAGPKLPPGIGLRQPLPAEQGLSFSDVAIVTSTQQMLSLAPVLNSLRRNSFGGTVYASFHQGSCVALAHSSAEKKLEVGIVIDPKQPYVGVTRKIRDRTYAVFIVPNALVRTGAPYFRRASKINDCYLGTRRPSEVISREPAQFREQREHECKQLRTLPIDSTEKPLDLK